MAAFLNKFNSFVEKRVLKKGCIGVLNVFTLSIKKNQILEKEIEELKLQRMNNHVDLALYPCILYLAIVINDFATKGTNSEYAFYGNLSMLDLIILWKILTIRGKKATPFIGPIFLIKSCIHLNLFLRQLIPWEIIHPTTLGGVYETITFSFLVCSTYLNYDFKYNACIITPIFMVGSYF